MKGEGSIGERDEGEGRKPVKEVLEVSEARRRLQPATARWMAVRENKEEKGNWNPRWRSTTMEFVVKGGATWSFTFPARAARYRIPGRVAPCERGWTSVEEVLRRILSDFNAATLQDELSV